MGLFSRKKAEHGMDVETLLAEANRASPTPPVAMSGSFRLTVEDVFAIAGRGTVVTGSVEAGTVTTGMDVQLLRGGQVLRSVKVGGVEMFRKVLDSATVGDNVGLLLPGVGRDDVAPGDVVSG